MLNSNDYQIISQLIRNEMELLGTAEWLDESQELLLITRKDYHKMVDVLEGGIV